MTKITVEVPLERSLIEAYYREREAADRETSPWLAEVGQVGYMGVAGSEMPVRVEAIGWIDYGNGGVQRVYQVSYLSPKAHGWYSDGAGQPVRVEYGTGTSSVEGELSPEPHDVGQARWRRDTAAGRYTIGIYPPFQTEAEWREAPYSLDNLPASPEKVPA